MTTILRHKTTPAPYGCRWCGIEQRSHGQVFSRAVGGHHWVQPTTEQIKARMTVRRKQRLKNT